MGGDFKKPDKSTRKRNVIPSRSYSRLKDIFQPRTAPSKVFFYHGECIDGAAAMWCAANKFGGEMAYVPLTHIGADEVFAKIAEHINADTEVIFADFTPSPGVMERIMGIMKDGGGAVKVIDHHETAINQYRNVPAHPQLTLVLDQNRAGGRMVYDELYNDGFLTPEDQLPQIVRVAEVLDLNRTDFDRFDELSSYVDAFGLTGPHRDYVVAEMVNNKDMETMKVKGAEFHTKKLGRMNKLFERKSRRLDLKLPEVSKNELSVLMVPARIKDFGRYFDNEMTRQACMNGCDLAMSYYYENNDRIAVSIRCGADTDIDLSAVGETLGKMGRSGGGRKTAAAAVFTPDQFYKTFGFKAERHDPKPHKLPAKQQTFGISNVRHLPCSAEESSPLLPSVYAKVGGGGR